MGRFGKAATRVVSVAGLAWSGSATAFELTGAWTPDTDKSNQVFVQSKTTNRLDFATARSLPGADRARPVLGSVLMEQRRPHPDNVSAALISGASAP
jgi:hypothetical protein